MYKRQVQVGGLYEPLEALEIDYRVVVDALEGDARHRAAEVSVVRRDDVHVLGPYDDVHWLVLGEALVKAAELAAEELHNLSLIHI